MKTTTDNGYRSACCYAPIKVGRKQIKKTKLKVSIWVCTKCKKRDVNIVEYNRNDPSVSTRLFADPVDTVDEAMLESDVE